MNLQSMWAQKAPWSDQTVQYYISKYQIAMPTQLFDEDFNLREVLGKQEK